MFILKPVLSHQLAVGEVFHSHCVETKRFGQPPVKTLAIAVDEIDTGADFLHCGGIVLIFLKRMEQLRKVLAGVVHDMIVEILPRALLALPDLRAVAGGNAEQLRK